MSEQVYKLTVKIELGGKTGEFLKELRKFMELNLALNAAIGEFEELVVIPDKRCACHISPPCGDCVEWEGLREARSALVKAVDNHTAGAESLGAKLAELFETNKS